MSELRITGDADPRIAALEAELAAARVEMQAFTAAVSHDLRAPLRHITSFAQLLQEEAGPGLGDEARAFLGHLTGAAKQLAQMLDALLALSRAGTLPVYLQAVDLQALVGQRVQERMLAVSARHPERVVRWQVATDLPPVQADAHLLAAALVQVLDNAVKFTQPRADTAIGISARIDATTGAVHCTVQDNGVGFHPEQAPKLFQPFVRLHSSSQFEGLGMGLALVAKSLQRMGGQARITAVADGGCCLTLVLPRAA